MKSPAQAVAVLIAVGFAWGVLHLFGLTFAGGEVYPELSTLRSDPLGAKLLYESLARIPGVRVSRNYRPLESLEGAGATFVFLDFPPSQVAANARLLQAIAARGNRVVLAMNGQPDAAPHPLYESWGVRLSRHAERGDSHSVTFAEANGWTERERIAARVLAIEKPFGKGSVVLLAKSDDFANHATLASDRLDLVTAVLGNKRFVFDEHHLGIAESASVVALARQFGLSGFAFGLAICAALWIWRASSAFPPPRPAPAASGISGRTSHSGLVTLLRRNIPPNELAALCWQQWLTVNRGAAPPDRLERAAVIARNPGADPVAAAREIQRAIQSKGNS